jgi:hypothetical protein
LKEIKETVNSSCINLILVTEIYNF